MAYSSVAITPGAGANIAVDSVSGLDLQVVKLDFGASGASSPAQIDGSGNLKVNVAAASTLTVTGAGGTFPITAASAIPVSAPSALGVSAPVATPVYVRVSNTSTAVDTIPVSGTVTGNQGTAAANSSAWPIKISDGTNTAPLDSSNGNALKVSVVASVTPQAQTDKSSYTEGTSVLTPVGGEYNSSPTLPSSGQAAAAQITQYRGLHVNPRNSSGTEIGTSSNPIRIDPTGTTTQPVNHTQINGNAVITVANGIQKVGVSDGSGNAYSASNPVPTTPVPNAATFWSNHVAYTASQTAQAIRTPTSGKTSYVQGLVIIPTGGGTLEIFDDTAGATADLVNGTMPASGVFPIPFDPPRPLSAVNNVLKYTTGSGSTGDLMAWGYEQ
jgi:hypothetical protein